MKYVSLIATAVVLNLTAPPAVAGAAPETVATELVNYTDLDLSSKAGQDRLKNRISFAAYRVCLADAPASPSPMVADPGCYRAAVANALAQKQLAVARATGTIAAAPPVITGGH
ncbi:MAG: UrcA family protein [Sphingomicrobium sp.]